MSKSSALNQETAKCLRHSADIMLKGGYIKGRLRDGTGAHCALGAIYASSLCEKILTQAIAAISEAVTPMLPAEGIYDKYNSVRVNKDSKPHAHVFAWSNNLCNSAKDVACVMRACAEYLDSESEDQHGD